LSAEKSVASLRFGSVTLGVSGLLGALALRRGTPRKR
jgi:hypothetical protein